MNDERDAPTRAADACVRAALDAAAASLPAADLERLRAARAAALARRPSAPRMQRLDFGAPRRVPLRAASALATAALLLIVLHAQLGRVAPRETTALDAELLGSSTALELLEDLEFYEWLDGDSPG